MDRIGGSNDMLFKKSDSDQNELVSQNTNLLEGSIVSNILLELIYLNPSGANNYRTNKYIKPFYDKQMKRTCQRPHQV